MDSRFIEIKTRLLAASINTSRYVSVNFTNDFINPLLEKLATKNREIMLMGDYNINILNCNSDNETSDIKLFCNRLYFYC